MLQHGEVRIHRGRLEDDADPVAPLGAALLRVDAEDRDGAAVARAVALEHLDRRRLAGAVRSEQAEDLALLDLEVDPADGLDLPVGLVQVVDGDGGRHLVPSAGALRRTGEVDRHDAGLGEGRLGTAGQRRRDPAAVGLVADGDDRLAALGGGVADGVGRCARRQALVGLGGRAERAGDLLGGLAGAEQRARDDRGAGGALGGEPSADVARLLAACGVSGRSSSGSPGAASAWRTR